MLKTNQTNHETARCLCCGEALSAYDDRMGPGDGTCAACAWDEIDHPQRGLSQQLLSGLAQSGRLRSLGAPPEEVRERETLRPRRARRMTYRRGARSGRYGRTNPS